METPNDFLQQKKNYSHLHTSLFRSQFKPSSSDAIARKKIIPTLANSGLRDVFKKTFLPLLIDIFELRQMIDTHKLHQQSPQFHHFDKISKTPQEILSQLTQMQKDIEESKRWCEGVIMQITKGIEEAQEALHQESSWENKNATPQQNRFSLAAFMKKCKEWLWTPKQLP